MYYWNITYRIPKTGETMTAFLVADTPEIASALFCKSRADIDPATIQIEPYNLPETSVPTSLRDRVSIIENGVRTNKKDSGIDEIMQSIQEQKTEEEPIYQMKMLAPLSKTNSRLCRAVESIVEEQVHTSFQIDGRVRMYAMLTIDGDSTRASLWGGTPAAPVLLTFYDLENNAWEDVADLDEYPDIEKAKTEMHALMMEER